jgi:hypothetical protein
MLSKKYFAVVAKFKVLNFSYNLGLVWAGHRVSLSHPFFVL